MELRLLKAPQSLPIECWLWPFSKVRRNRQWRSPGSASPLFPPKTPSTGSGEGKSSRLKGAPPSKRTAYTTPLTRHCSGKHHFTHTPPITLPTFPTRTTSSPNTSDRPNAQNPRTQSHYPTAPSHITTSHNCPRYDSILASLGARLSPQTSLLANITLYTYNAYYLLLYNALI